MYAFSSTNTLTIKKKRLFLKWIVIHFLCFNKTGNIIWTNYYAINTLTLVLFNSSFFWFSFVKFRNLSEDSFFESRLPHKKIEKCNLQCYCCTYLDDMALRLANVCAISFVRILCPLTFVQPSKPTIQYCNKQQAICTVSLLHLTWPIWHISKWRIDKWSVKEMCKVHCWIFVFCPKLGLLQRINPRTTRMQCLGTFIFSWEPEHGYDHWDDNHGVLLSSSLHSWYKWASHTKHSFPY